MSSIEAFVRQLSRQPWRLAVLVSGLVVLWLASGLLRSKPAAEPAVAAASSGAVVPRVQIRRQQAEAVTRHVSVYGRTAPARVVELKAETSGRVVSLGLNRGAAAPEGAVILALDLRDRAARLQQARASVAQQESAYKGQQELLAKNYVSETQLAQTLAQLETARAELTRAELDLDYMRIRAPFPGVLQERRVEVGDFVRPGDAVATFVDNTRLIVTGSVAEADIAHVRAGRAAVAVLATGGEARGRIRYVAPVADNNTRTFTVELEVANPGGKLPAGVTAEIRIPADEVMAQRVSPALLTLDPAGQLGIKTVEADGHVAFHHISIARSETNGVWVTGLPATSSIIVVGQGYVSEGQKVEAVAAPQDTALAAAPVRQ